MKTNLNTNISVIDTINNQTNLYSPLIMTKHISSASYLAELMYLDLPDDNLIKQVVDEVANKPAKVTGFINFNGKLESNNKSVLSKSDNFKPAISKSAGVYLFTHTLTGFQYIGSASNFFNRVQNHRSLVRNPSTKFHKFVSDNTWKDFNFGTLYETTNYLMEFKSKYPLYKLSIGEMVILSHLTHLEARTLEQSLITQFSPELNSSGKDVQFSYNSWDPSTLDQSNYLKYTNAVQVEVWLKEPKEILTTYPSIYKAAKGLGVSRNLISAYLNRPYSFEKNLLELNVFVKTNEGVIDNSPINFNKPKTYPKIDYNTNLLEEGLIYALSPDKLDIKHTFKSSQEATKMLNPIKYKNNNKINWKVIYNYLNQEKLVNTELGIFYFICNPLTLINNKSKTASKTLWIIDLTDGLALKFDSILSASQYFNLKSRSSISLYLDKYTLYRKRYQIVSNNEFLKFFPDVTDTKYYCDLNKLPLIKTTSP